MLVFEATSSCGIVKGPKAGRIWSSHQQKCGTGRNIWFGVKENIGGLAWCNENGVCVEGLYINGVNFDHGEGVVGYAEEELIIKCSINETQEVSLSWFYTQLKCVWCPTPTKQNQPNHASSSSSAHININMQRSMYISN